uniref:Vesicle transport protein n=1 Tax=Timema bartmani TaxID=61472 RepID=A0A7R9EYK3_9NEOP|nr:unnamed protein product [Timema bartmani]
MLTYVGKRPQGKPRKIQEEQITESVQTRVQRILGFCCFVFVGILCFTLAALYIPVLLFKARKFALLYTMGSLFTICSFSFLWGPINHLKHLFSRERLPFTAAYFGSLVATLYFALSVQSTPLTVLFAVAQVMALLWFLISYIPGGQTGLAFFTRLCSSAVTSTVSKTITSHAKQLVDSLRLISHVRQSLSF